MEIPHAGAPAAPINTPDRILIREGVAALLAVLDEKRSHKFLRLFATGLERAASREGVRGMRSAVKDRAEAESAALALTWFREHAAEFLTPAGE